MRRRLDIMDRRAASCAALVVVQLLLLRTASAQYPSQQQYPAPTPPTYPAPAYPAPAYPAPQPAYPQPSYSGPSPYQPVQPRYVAARPYPAPAYPAPVYPPPAYPSPPQTYPSPPQAYSAISPYGSVQFRAPAPYGGYQGGSSGGGSNYGLQTGYAPVQQTCGVDTCAGQQSSGYGGQSYGQPYAPPQGPPAYVGPPPSYPSASPYQPGGYAGRRRHKRQLPPGAPGLGGGGGQLPPGGPGFLPQGAGSGGGGYGGNSYGGGNQNCFCRNQNQDVFGALPYKSIQQVQECDCRNSCNGDSQCQAAAYDQVFSQCNMFSSSPQQIASSQKILFQKQSSCGGGACVPFKVAQKTLIGIVYKAGTATSVDDCLSQCVSDKPRCKSGHYYSDTNECLLKQECRSTRPELFVDAIDRQKQVTYFEPCACTGSSSSSSNSNSKKLAVLDSFDSSVGGASVVCTPIQLPRKALIGSVYMSDSASSVGGCIAKCTSDRARCKAGHYFPDTGDCLLKTENKNTKPELFVDAHPADGQVIYFEPGCPTGAGRIPSGLKHITGPESFDGNSAVLDSGWGSWSRCEYVLDNRVFRIRSKPCSSLDLDCLEKSFEIDECAEGSVRRVKH